MMWRGDRKAVSERMKIEFRLHRREHCLRANKRMKRWPAVVLRLTVGQSPIFLMAAPPFNSLCCCKCPIATVQYELLCWVSKPLWKTTCHRRWRGSRKMVQGRERGRKGKEARKEEWMNHFRNGTLKTVKLLNNLADAADVCVCMCARLCCLFVPRLWGNTTQVTVKADYEIKWCAAGK